MPFDRLRAVSMVERLGATLRKVEGWEREGVRVKKAKEES